MHEGKLAQMVLVTWELTGQQLSDAAVNAIVDELAQYPQQAVETALDRCRKELRRVALADVLDRIPNGHPGVEEAWALIARWVCASYENADDREQFTFLWTDEMAEAAGLANGLRGDRVAAHAAFKEKYGELLAMARANKTPPKWRVSLGWNVRYRTDVIVDGIKSGKITAEYGRKLLPPDIDDDRVQQLLDGIGDITKRIGN